MPKYNDMIELNIEDMALIEEALRRAKQELTLQALEEDGPAEDDADETVRQIHELLGRLHNQKVFYRPQTGAYIGG